MSEILEAIDKTLKATELTKEEFEGCMNDPVCRDRYWEGMQERKSEAPKLQFPTVDRIVFLGLVVGLILVVSVYYLRKSRFVDKP